MTYVRTFEQVFRDGLWPDRFPDTWEDDRRRMAILEVLCRIPEDDYKILSDTIDSWEWFVPDYRTSGAVYPFPATEALEEDNPQMPFAKVLYLSPILEKRTQAFVMAVVAHELAHLVLGHQVYVTKEYTIQEDSAWALVRKWGFEREEKEHERYYKWRETWENSYIEKLKQQ